VGVVVMGSVVAVAHLWRFVLMVVVARLWRFVLMLVVVAHLWRLMLTVRSHSWCSMLTMKHDTTHLAGHR
jgi:hypothetical protein